MKVLRNVVAGSLESSDVLISIEPAAGLSLDVDSVVMKQWGAAIRTTAESMLREAGITDATVQIRDRGALECTLRARMETAIRRCRVQAA